MWKRHNRGMAAFLLLLFLPCAFGETLTLRWNELQGAVAQREATVVTTDNKQFKGVITSVTEEAVMMERAPGGRVDRAAIREVRVRQVKGPRRAIFTAGAGAGAGLGLLPWAISDSRMNVSDSSRVAQWAGITAGATVAGYFIGRQLDTKETVIRIVK